MYRGRRVNRDGLWATTDQVACVVDMTGGVKGRICAAHDKAGITTMITRWCATRCARA